MGQNLHPSEDPKARFHQGGMQSLIPKYQQLVQLPDLRSTGSSTSSIATSALAAGALAAAAGAARRGARAPQTRAAKAQAVACRGLAKMKIDEVDLKDFYHVIFFFNVFFS